MTQEKHARLYNLILRVRKKIDDIAHPGNPRRGRVTVRHDYSNMVGRRPIQNDSDERNELNQELKALKDRFKHRQANKRDEPIDEDSS